MAEPLLHPLAERTRPAIERLWQLYRHDLSEFRGQHGAGGFRGTLPSRDATYEMRGLQPFLTPDPNRGAFLFTVDDARPVGFALVTGLTGERLLMAEFFVVRGARRQGIGGRAVMRIFELHPGTWEIPFQEHNAAAARFWRGVAAGDAVTDVREQRRPVPGKPEVPPDVWITLTTRLSV